MQVVKVVRLGACLLLVLSSSQSKAELKAEHVAILANLNSRDSLEVAQHYATRRGISEAQIIRLDLPLTETISRTEYERLVVSPLRRQLEKRDLAKSTRALVTTYGVPLRVGAPVPTDRQQQWRKDALARLDTGRLHIAMLEQVFHRIAPDPIRHPDPTPADPAPGSLLEADRTAVLFGRVERALREAIQRVGRLEARQDIERWNKELTGPIMQFGGLAALVRASESDIANQRPREAKSREEVRTQISQAEPLIKLFTTTPVSHHRAKVYQLVERFFGVQAALGLATGEVDMLAFEQADGSLDSEVSLLWWDSGMYRLAFRWPNPLYHEPPSSPNLWAGLPPTLMVSRLDAPRPELAKTLVDRALEAEQSGLSGTIYLDARGLAAASPADTYALYDQSLRDLADLLKGQTAHRVVLENTEQRFSKSGEAPDVALYTGWYRLRQYEDAFTFRPGAIGYHMASAEAVSIHERREKGWCKNALERGITATLGSIGEPYLDTFPEPHKFFGLLLTGQYTLAEAYALTSRYGSWRMVLFGDPLYNPWRGKGLVKKEGFAGQSNTPVPPSNRPFSDPLQALKQVRQEREQQLTQLEQLLQQADQTKLLR
ncbi:MAG: TIGR03790 family protein [Nitrospiraceae bacterium]